VTPFFGCPSARGKEVFLMTQSEHAARKAGGATALLVIDMQNDFVRPGAPACVSGALATVPAIVRVLEYFRARKWPVFHVIREYRRDGSDAEITRMREFTSGVPYVVAGTTGAEIVPELTPLYGEYRIVKPRFSAFLGTKLDFILRRLLVETVVICGTQYPHCIRATAYDALSRDYHTIVLTDATSAETAEVAEANIRDMSGAGIQCIDFDRLRALIEDPRASQRRERV
jgi:nicotinamidase-related amidase